MQRHGAHYDVVASADTLVYLGALDEAMRAAACALRPGGYLCFTVEALTIMVIHATPEHERRASP